MTSRSAPGWPRPAGRCWSRPSPRRGRYPVRRPRRPRPHRFRHPRRWTVLIAGSSPGRPPHSCCRTPAVRMTVLLHIHWPPLSTRAMMPARALRTGHAARRRRMVVTSEWTHQQVLTRYAIPPAGSRGPRRRPVAAPARPVRGHLIYVGVLGPREAASSSRRSPTSLTRTGTACRRIARPRPGLRRTIAGPSRASATTTASGSAASLTGAALATRTASADLLVAPSRSETSA